MKQLTSLEAKKLTETRSEAIILRYLSFWQSKAKTKSKNDPHGRPWIIQTAEEFIERGVLYSKPTIYRALRKLRDVGLIELEKHWHPYRKNGCTPITASWIRVVDDLEVRIVEAEMSEKNNSEFVEESIYPDQNDHSLYTGELTGELTGDHIEAGKPVQITKPTPSEKIAERRSKFSKTPNPILEKMRNDRRRERKKTSLNATDVFFDFMSQSRENFPEHVPDPKSAVTLKFAKTFLAKCRQHKQSDEEVLQLIANAVVGWDEFKSWKKSKAGSGIKAEYANLKDMMRFTEQLIAYSNEEMAPEPEEAGHVDKDGMFIPEGWGEQ